MEELKLENIAIKIDNKNQERTFATFCKDNRIIKLNANNMDKSRTYYYKYVETGQQLTFLAVQQNEEYLFRENLQPVSPKRFTELFNEVINEN
jgi:hypothetical protein